jgi:hypothetical protein
MRREAVAADPEVPRPERMEAAIPVHERQKGIRDAEAGRVRERAG